MDQPAELRLYLQPLPGSRYRLRSDEGGLKDMFETASNLRTFWIKVKVECPEVGTSL